MTWHHLGWREAEVGAEQEAHLCVGDAAAEAFWVDMEGKKRLLGMDEAGCWKITAAFVARVSCLTPRFLVPAFHCWGSV